MATDDQINVKLEADPSGLKTGMEGAASSVQSATGRITAMLGQIGSALGIVSSKMVAIGAAPIKLGSDGGAAAVAAVKSIRSQIGELEGGIKNVIGKLNGFTAAVGAMAAGGMFKSMMGSFLSEAGEVGKLAARLSITTVEASHLNVALGQIGSSSDDYLGAVGMLNKNLRTNADYMKQLGVQTTDTTGKQLTQQQIMQSALTTLSSYKSGYDRNMAAMAMFGKGADEVQGLLRLNNETMEKATKLAKDYGNEFSGESIAGAKKYKESLAVVRFALEQFGQSIGEQMLPYVKRTADWFANEGPAAFRVFNEVLDEVFAVYDTIRGLVSDVLGTVGGVVSDLMSTLSSASGTVITTADAIKAAFAIVRIALEGLRAGFLIILEAIIGTVQLWGGKLVTIFSAVATAWNTKSLSAGKKVWDEGFAAVEKRAVEHGQKMMKIASEANANMRALFNGETPGGPSAPEAPAPAAAKPSGGGRTFNAKEKTDKAEDIIKAQLAVDKAYAEKTLAIAKQSLAEQQELNEDRYKNNLISLDAYYKERQRIIVAGLQLELDAKSQELKTAQAAESNPKVKSEKDLLALKANRIKLEGEVAVAEAKLNAAAISGAHERANAEQALSDQLGDIRRQAVENAGMAEVEHDRALMAQKKALGLANEAEVIASEQALEDRRYAIQFDGLAKRLEMARLDPVKRAQIYAEMEKAEADHQQKITDISYKAEQERLKNVLDVQKTVESSAASNAMAVLDRTKSLIGAIKDTLNDFHKSILKNIIQNGVEKASKVIFSSDGVLGKALGSIFGTSQTKDGMPLDASKNALRVTNVDGGIAGVGTEGSATEGILGKIQEHFSGIFDSLKKVFSDLFSSIGNIFSSLASSGSSGGGGGFGSMLGSFLSSVASFDVGTDAVPRDMLALVHAGERITPAKYTGKGDGQAMTQNNHFHISGPVDTRTQEQIAQKAALASTRARVRFGT